MTTAVLAPTALASGGTSGYTALWYATRATGLVALVLLSASVVLGVIVWGRTQSPRWPRFAVSALHRNVSLLAVVFLVVHIVTSIVDPYAGIGWTAAAIPFVDSYRTFWLGLGTVSVDLLVAVLVTTAVRLRLGYRMWRGVHLLAYAAWPVAVFHTFGTGTDARHGLQLVVTVACILAVLGVVGWRLARGGPGRVAQRAAAAGATGVFAVLLVALIT